MTREEAISKVRGYLTDYLPSEDYEEIGEIIKALEQEPNVIDKIRAEIDAKFNDRPSSYNHEQRREFYRDVLTIIDKYRIKE